MAMARWILLLPALLAFGVGPLLRTAPAQVDLPDLVDHVRPSIVTVETYSALGRRIGQATGFFVDGQRLITTRHAVIEGRHVWVVFSDDARYPVTRLIAEDEVGDLVLLEADLKDVVVPGLTIAPEEVRDGEDIFVVGGPLGLEHTVTRGIVSGRTDAFHSIEMLQFNAAISRGSSGSPVMNMKGEVVGIAAARLPAGESLNFAIPADRVMFLKPAPQPFEKWAGRLLRDDDDAPIRAPVAAAPRNEGDLLEEMRARVDASGAALVTVHALDEQHRPLRQATGFFVSQTRVITVPRVLHDAARVVAVAADGREFEVTGLAGEDRLGGLVCVEVVPDAAPPPSLRISNRRPYRREPLMVVGRTESGDLDVALTRTRVTLTHVPGFGPLLVVGPSEALGEAGRPVLDARGNVMAVVAERIDGDTSELFLVPATRIQARMRMAVAPLERWSCSNEFAAPDHPQNLLWQVLPDLATERWLAARRRLGAAVPESRRTADDWLMLAICHNALQESAELLEAATRAVDLDPQSSLGHYYRALGYAGLVDRDPVAALEQTRDACRAAIEADPRFNFHSYITLASVLADFNELEQAVTAMEQALDVWSDRPEIHAMLANFYMRNSTSLTKQGKFGLGDKYRKMSLRTAAMAVELAPYASWTFRQLAQSAALNEAHTTAIRAADRAVELAPGDPAALDTLARIHLIAGDKKTALEVCRALAEIDPAAGQRLLDLIQQGE